MKVRAAIDDAARALHRVIEFGVSPVDTDDAVVLIREVEQLRRLADAAGVETLAAIDRTGVYGPDGHASAKTMVRHYAKLSAGDAAGRAKAAKVCATLPEVGESGQLKLLELARALMAELSQQHGVPAVDPVRTGVAAIVDRLEERACVA